ncbi:MAG: hypothetical protein QM758_14025 [Armatimonas sp.]
MDEYLTAEEALTRFGATKKHIQKLRYSGCGVRSGLFRWRYTKRDILRVMLIGDAGKILNDLSPLVRIVNAVLLQAANAGEKSLVFEPQKDELSIRYGSGNIPRASDTLECCTMLPNNIKIPVIARLKDLAGLALDVQDSTQSGTIQLTYRERSWDCPIVVEPTPLGERVRVEIRPAE